jgi:FkbM family methyltransferase
LLCLDISWVYHPEPGRAVDVGANIGYMTSLMAHKVGLSGKVIAFEPHPAIYKRLVNNVQDWHIEKN